MANKHNFGGKRETEQLKTTEQDKPIIVVITLYNFYMLQGLLNQTQYRLIQ